MENDQDTYRLNPLQRAAVIYFTYIITTLVLEFIIVQVIMKDSYFEPVMVIMWGVLFVFRAPVNTLYLYAMYKLNVCRRIINPLWVATESAIILAIFVLLCYALSGSRLIANVPIIALYLFPYVFMTIGLVIGKKLHTYIVFRNKNKS